MNRPSLVQPVDGRSVVSTSVGITLVVAGAILRFAVTATFAHVLNAHVAGVIVMLAGVFALLLSLLVWGPLNRRRSRSGGYDRGRPPLARQRSIYRRPVAAVTGSPRWRGRRPPGVMGTAASSRTNAKAAREVYGEPAVITRSAAAQPAGDLGTQVLTSDVRSEARRRPPSAA